MLGPGNAEGSEASRRSGQSGSVDTILATGFQQERHCNKGRGQSRFMIAAVSPGWLIDGEGQAVPDPLGGLVGDDHHVASLGPRVNRTCRADSHTNIRDIQRMCLRDDER